jgi:hypothetical protein
VRLCVCVAAQPGFSEAKEERYRTNEPSSTLSEDGWYTFRSMNGNRFRYQLLPVDSRSAAASAAESGAVSEADERERKRYEAKVAEQERAIKRELTRQQERERLMRLQQMSAEFDPGPVAGLLSRN